MKTIICHSLSDKYSLTICETMGNIMTVTLYTNCNENFLVFDNCLKKKPRTTLFLLKDRLTDKLLTDFCWHMPLLFIFWYFIFHLIYPFIYMLLKCHMWYKIAVWFHFLLNLHSVISLFTMLMFVNHSVLRCWYTPNTSPLKLFHAKSK